MDFPFLGAALVARGSTGNDSLAVLCTLRRSWAQQRAAQHGAGQQPVGAAGIRGCNKPCKDRLELSQAHTRFVRQSEADLLTPALPAGDRGKESKGMLKVQLKVLPGPATRGPWQKDLTEGRAERCQQQRFWLKKHWDASTESTGHCKGMALQAPLSSYTNLGSLGLPNPH